MCWWLKAKLEERVVVGVSCGRRRKSLQRRERERERGGCGGCSAADEELGWWR
jgi:hypothetical protein